MPNNTDILISPYASRKDLQNYYQWTKSIERSQSLLTSGRMRVDDKYDAFGLLCNISKKGFWLKYEDEIWYYTPYSMYGTYKSSACLPQKPILEWAGINPKATIALDTIAHLHTCFMSNSQRINAIVRYLDHQLQNTALLVSYIDISIDYTYGFRRRRYLF